MKKLWMIIFSFFSSAFFMAYADWPEAVTKTTSLQLGSIIGIPNKGTMGLGLNNLSLKENRITGFGALQKRQVKVVIERDKAEETQEYQVSITTTGKGKKFLLGDIPFFALVPFTHKIEVKALVIKHNKEDDTWTYLVDVLTSDLVKIPGFSVNEFQIVASLHKDSGLDLKILKGKMQIHEKVVDFGGAGSALPKKEIPSISLDIQAENLSLQDLFGATIKVPGASEVELKRVHIDNNEINVKAMIKGVEVEGEVFFPEGTKRPHFAFFARELSLAKILHFDKIPEVINDLEVEAIALIIAPGGEDSHSYHVDDLPEIVREEIKKIGGDAVEISEGVNLFANITARNSSPLKKGLEKIGITDSLKMMGPFDPLLLFSKENRKNSYKSLKLEAKLPSMEIEGLPNGSTLTDGVFKLHGIDGGLNISVGMVLDLFVTEQDHIEFSSEVDFSFTKNEQNILFAGKSKVDWNAPAGTSWINLHELGINIDFTRERENGKTSTEFGLDVYAKSTIKGKELAVDVILKKTDHIEAELKITTNLTLEDIPIVENMPGASNWGLKEVIITSKGIEAKTLLNGVNVNAALFKMKTKTSSAWIFVIDQENGSLAQLIPVPGLDQLEIMKQIHVEESFVLLSSKKIVVKRLSQIPDFAQDIFKPILEQHAVGMTFQGGITFGAVFNPFAASSDLSDVLKKIGISGEAYIGGSIGGIFGGPPHISLEADLPEFSPSKIKGMSHILGWIDGIRPRFLVTLSDEGIEAEMEMVFGINVNGDHIVFDGGIQFELKGDEVAANMFGDMRGDWHEPFGLRFFVFKGVALEGGIADGALDFGFMGKIEVAKDVYEVAADVEIEFESVIPSIQGIAFKLHEDVVGISQLIDVMELMSGQKVPFKVEQLPFFELHDAELTFATPGAENEELDLKGPGFGAKGKLTFMGHNIEEVLVSIYPDTGLKIYDNIDELHLGILDVNKALFDLQVNWTALPHLKIQGDIKMLFIEQKVLVDIEPPYSAKFDLKETLGPFGEGELKAEITGVNFSSGVNQNPDFYVEGDVRNSHIGDWLANQGKQKFDSIFNQVHADIVNDEKKINNAQAQVNLLNNRISNARARVRADRNYQLNGVSAAVARVNSLKVNVAQDFRNRDGCAWYNCAWVWPYWEGVGLATLAVERIAEGVLWAVERLIVSFPIDLDPRVSGLIIEKGVADVALNIARKILQGIDSAASSIKQIGDNIITSASRVLKNFKINDISFKASLASYFKNHIPWLFNIDIVIANIPFKQRIFFYPSFAPKDIQYNIEMMTPAALKGLEVGIKLLGKALGPIGNRISNVILTKFHQFENFVSKELNLHQDFLDNINKLSGTANNIKNSQVDRVARLKAEAAKNLEEYKRTNGRKKINYSELVENATHLDNVLLEIGHSGNCISPVNGGIYVSNDVCSDSIQKQRWVTRELENGYVHIISNGKCLKPNSNSDQFGVALQLDACDTRQEGQYWKIVKNDKLYVNFMNKTNSRCLHFADPNALPGHIAAQWGACAGDDTQAIRLVKSTKPEVFAEENPMHSTIGQFCLISPLSLDSQGNTHRNDKIPALVKLPLMKGAQYGNDKSIAILGNIFPNFRKDSASASQAYAVPCQEILNDGTHSGLVKEDVALYQFNISKNINGYIRLISKASGKCLSVDKNSAVISRGCTLGDDMFWDYREESTDGNFRLISVKNKQCLSFISGANPLVRPIHTRPCESVRNSVVQVRPLQEFSFKLPNLRVRRIYQGISKVDPIFKDGQNQYRICQAFDQGGFKIGVIGSDNQCYVRVDEGHVIHTSRYYALDPRNSSYASLDVGRSVASIQGHFINIDGLNVCGSPATQEIGYYYQNRQACLTYKNVLSLNQVEGERFLISK